MFKFVYPTLAARKSTYESKSAPQYNLAIAIFKIECIHCGLFFKDGDLIEIDHKIPRSQGVQDSYDNLQLLHGHCHDVKTVTDKVAVVVREMDEDYLNANPF